MAHLLHIDSSARYEDSVTRAMTAWFVENWLQAHPGGQVTRLDLAREPLPHFARYRHASFQRNREKTVATPISCTPINHSKSADTVIIGAPMYNYAVPSSLKAWIDRICIMPNFADQKTGRCPLGRQQAGGRGHRPGR